MRKISIWLEEELVAALAEIAERETRKEEGSRRTLAALHRMALWRFFRQWEAENGPVEALAAVPAPGKRRGSA